MTAVKRASIASFVLTVAVGAALSPSQSFASEPFGRLDERTVVRSEYDGVSDDLLTAGLGLEGLRNPQPPAFASPLQPTARELRRRAIWQNYRSLIDLSPSGGAGRDFGPRPGERIAGIERLGAVRAQSSAAPSPTQAPAQAPAQKRAHVGTGAQRSDAGGSVLHSVLLQIPRAFDPRKPCLVAVASSGSRGIWGALPTAGEWGLRSGCAVVHTDKGTGTGFFDVQRGRALRIDGTSTTDLVQPSVGFVPSDAAALDGLRGAAPETIVVRHAGSGLNPEADWGRYLIDATAIAFDWLNAEFASSGAPTLTPANTRVIAAGISNGGGVVLRALALDRGSRRDRWFDAAVAVEPNVTVRGPSRALYDYASLAGLLQPCAMLAEPDVALLAMASLAMPRPALEAWCANLAAAGDVRGEDTVARAADARRRLLAAGFRPEALALGPLNVLAQLWPAVVSTYAAAHARLPPGRMHCGLSHAFVDATGAPRPPSDEEWARLYSDSSGIPPTAGVTLVREVDGVRSMAAAFAPEAIRCLRRLFDDPRGTDVALARGLWENALEAAAGEDRPVVVLHGRADSLVLPVHTSHAWYVAASGASRSAGSELRYYELLNAQHFDAFIALPGMSARFVPTQPWLLAAMDAVQARLDRGVALPASQVLRAKPGAPFTGIPVRASRDDLIRLQAGKLEVPE